MTQTRSLAAILATCLRFGNSGDSRGVGFKAGTVGDCKCRALIAADV